MLYSSFVYFGGLGESQWRVCGGGVVVCGPPAAVLARTGTLPCPAVPAVPAMPAMSRPSNGKAPAFLFFIIFLQYGGLFTGIYAPEETT